MRRYMLTSVPVGAASVLVAAGAPIDSDWMREPLYSRCSLLNCVCVFCVARSRSASGVRAAPERYPNDIRAAAERRPTRATCKRRRNDFASGTVMAIRRHMEVISRTAPHAPSTTCKPNIG